MSTRRIAIGICLSALAATLLSVPVTAAGATIWVDQDGAAGPTSCEDAGTAPTTIKAGITSAAIGDTVRICPGTYEEIVRVGKRDLKLVSDTRYRAIIRPPAVLPDPAPTALVTVAANGVTLRGLRVSVPSSSCPLALVGILANGRTGTTVRNVRVLGGTNDQSMTCGLTTGITIAGGSATLDDSTVKNFSQTGILVGDGASATITDNTLLLSHDGAPPVDGQDSYPSFVHIRAGTATITDNTLLQDPDMLWESYTGVYLDDSVAKVGRNVIVGPAIGVGALDDVGGSDIFANTIRDGSTAAAGIDIYASAKATFRGNRVFGYEVGIYEHGAAGQVIKNNDFRGNGTDCTADSKHSTWTNNLGLTSSPKGLCSPT